MRPIFRDRDELPSASDLNATVKEALFNSENLIVVCSPNAVASHWVNEEIREFVRLGRQSRIFCIIVDGEAAPGETSTACFPTALAEAGLHEPLAADVRKWADGKYLARLKLIAGLLDIPLDQLRRRELQKRRKTWALITVASITVAAILVSAILFQITAKQRRNSGETLVAVKLSELRVLLNVEEDPTDLLQFDEWDERDLKHLISSSGTNKAALIESAMEYRGQGKKYWREGVMVAAIKRFRQSWALIAESYRRDRDDLSIFFELGQAEYWIGQVYLDLGDLDQAEQFFISYAEITRRLILLEPENAEWVLEMSYALSNLGIVQRGREVNNPLRTLQLMQSALEYNQLALVLDPTSRSYRYELGQSRAYLADAQRDVCDLTGALGSLRDNITLQSELLQDDNSSTHSMNRLAFALSGYARIQQMMGQEGKAKPNMERSLHLIEKVLALKPGDPTVLRRIIERKQRIAWLNAMGGDNDQAWDALNAMKEVWQDMMQDSADGDIRVGQAYAEYLLNLAWLARAMRNAEIAEQISRDSMGFLEGLAHKLPDNRVVGNLLTLAAFQYWELLQELPSSNIRDLLPEYNSTSGRVRACTDASMAVRKAIMLGDMGQAGKLTDYLLDHGYRESSFIQVCGSYSLCSVP